MGAWLNWCVDDVVPPPAPNCRCAVVEAEPLPTADELIDLAAFLAVPRLVVADRCDERDLALVRLAIALRARPRLALRALVEKWDVARIVRELY